MFPVVFFDLTWSVSMSICKEEKKSEWKPTDPVFFEVQVSMPVEFQPEDGGNTLEALGELMSSDGYDLADLVDVSRSELGTLGTGFSFDEVYSDRNMTDEVGDWDSVMS